MGPRRRAARRAAGDARSRSWPRTIGRVKEGDAAEAALGNLHPGAGTEVLSTGVRWRALHPVASLFAAPNRVWGECAICDADLQERLDEHPATCGLLDGAGPSRWAGPAMVAV